MAKDNMQYEHLELGVHVEYTEPDPEGLRIIAENMHHCFLHIPTGEVFVSRTPCTIEEFGLILPDTCIEEWEEMDLPDIKTINEMRISQVIY